MPTKNELAASHSEKLKWWLVLHEQELRQQVKVIVWQNASKNSPQRAETFKHFHCRYQVARFNFFWNAALCAKKGGRVVHSNVCLNFLRFCSTAKRPCAYHLDDRPPVGKQDLWILQQEAEDWFPWTLFVVIPFQVRADENTNKFLQTKIPSKKL